MTSPAGWTGTDRARSTELFETLARLQPDDPAHITTRNELAALHAPLARLLARRFAQRGESLDDLQQVASIGLLKAIDRFDPDRGLQFSTFATPTILGELKRYFRDTGWALRVPRGMKEMRTKVLLATEALQGELGRSPTPSEIAAHIGVDVDVVSDAIEAADAYSAAPLDAVTTSSGESRPLSETLGDIDAAIEQVDEREALRPLIAMLPERERTILSLRFFQEMTQSQIAEEMGISQMHVSRLLAKTLAQLRAGMAP